MLRQSIRFFAILMTVAMLIPGGCKRGGEEPDFRVEVRDAKGVAPGSPVKWQGIEIGTVKAAELSEGGVALSVELNPEYEGKLRSDARARPSRGFGARSQPALEIYGGVDSAVPLLPAGALVPEAGMADVVASISPTTWIVLGGILVALLLIGKIAKGVVKILAFAAALIFLVCSLWVVKDQFQKHRTELLGPELEARLQELAEDTIKSPEAITAWEAIQAEVSTLGLAAKDKGGAVDTQPDNGSQFAAIMCKAFPGCAPEFWLTGISSGDCRKMLESVASDGPFATSPERTRAIANYLKAVKTLWRKYSG